MGIQRSKTGYVVSIYCYRLVVDVRRSRRHQYTTGRPINKHTQKKAHMICAENIKLDHQFSLMNGKWIRFQYHIYYATMK